MREIARISESDRRELFRATAMGMRVSEAIVEKDFWVCWVLDYLFHDSPWQSKIAFKGGTSLSKAYNAIERFSEDVDLILDWDLLGFTEEELLQARSIAKQQQLNKTANQRCVDFLRTEFTPSIRQGLSELIGAEMQISIDDEDAQSILIRYPRAFLLEAIRPEIVLEIGPLAAWAPNEPKEIHPYAAEKYPDLFKKKFTVVTTVVAERTFWEKVTILHQEAHRPDNKPLLRRYSRHYYDLYRLSKLDIRNRALKRLDLLEKVVIFKNKFYHSAWASYDTAKPGSMQLMPSRHHLPGLKRDYEAMKVMIFGAIPSFDEILTELEILEKEINNL
jgi:predicted nucleotidyltransferase component of viral defense system